MAAICLGQSGPTSRTVDPLADEAQSQVMNHFEHYWAKYGDLWVTYVRGVRALDQSKIEYVEGRKGLTPVYESEELNEADKLNGVEWKGIVSLKSTAYRRYYFEDQPEGGIGFLHHDAQKRGWTDWMPADKGELLWQFHLERRAGKWKMEKWPREWEAAVYNRVECDPAAKVRFEPEKIVRLVLNRINVDSGVIYQLIIPPHQTSDPFTGPGNMGWWQLHCSSLGDVAPFSFGAPVATWQSWADLAQSGNSVQVNNKSGKPVAVSVRFSSRKLRPDEQDIPLLPLPAQPVTKPSARENN